MARTLGMPPGSEWVIIMADRPIGASPPTTLYLKRATQGAEEAFAFTAPYDDVRPAEGFTFTLLGRVTERRGGTFHWYLPPAPGLEGGLVIEVWWVEVPIGTSMIAVLHRDPISGLEPIPVSLGP